MRKMSQPVMDLIIDLIRDKLFRCFHSHFGLGKQVSITVWLVMDPYSVMRYKQVSITVWLVMDQQVSKSA